MQPSIGYDNFLGEKLSGMNFLYESCKSWPPKFQKIDFFQSWPFFEPKSGKIAKKKFKNLASTRFFDFKIL